MDSNAEQFDVQVTPAGVSGAWSLRELWRYRDLVWMLVRRNFVVSYKQTILGPAWAIIKPLLTTIVFTIVFGRLAKLPTDGIPPFLYYLCGTIAWGYFSSLLGGSAGTLQANAHLLGKVYFPRLVLPISGVFSHLIAYGIQMLFFLCFLVYFHYRNGISLCTPWLALFPILLLQMSALAVGAGLILAAMTIRYRDLGMLVGFGLQLWMYATPVAYSVTLIPAKYRLLYSCNPMVGVMDFYRRMFFGGGICTLEQWGISLLGTALLLLFGLWIFHRVEKNFIDTI